MENSSKRPKYFGNEFLRSTLENGFNRTDVKVLDSSINLATFGGENYCSDIYRVTVNYVFETDRDTSPREIHLILKDMKSVVEEELMKSKETIMYQKVIPELEAVLGGKELLAPKLLLAKKFDTEVYVFDDLNALGYELKDRTTGLNERDCIILLKKIAKFHAASMVFAEKFPELVDQIKDHVFQNGLKKSELLYTHMTGMAQTASELVKTWEGYESVGDQVFEISKTLHNKMIETCNRQDIRYKVLNHGDLWVNNFLYKDDNLVFVDLQMVNYGSPGIDINYFLYTSVPVDILKRRRYDFLRIYFKQFQDTLNEINYKQIPTWADFQYEMRKTEFSGVWNLLCIFPLVTLSKEHSKGNDIELFKDEEAWKAKKKIVFGTKRVEETFKYALDRFNDVGALD